MDTKPKKKNSNGDPSAEGASRLLRFLQEEKARLSPLLIVMHDYPDPDAIATAYALHYIAQKGFGIRCRMVYGGVIGRVENKAMVQLLKIPVNKIRVSDLKRYHNVAFIDTQPAFENHSFVHPEKATMVIDQHPSVKKPNADLVIVDTECGATSVIATRALLQSGLEIPQKLAIALTYGILSDTLNLHRARRGDVIRTYLDILPQCDMRILTKIQNPPKTKSFFTTLRRGLQKAGRVKGLIVAHLGPVDHPDLVSEITDFLLTYRGATRTLCTGRYNGKLYVSLRTSRAQDDAPKILRAIFSDPKQAGGHDSIAGGSFEVYDDLTADIWDLTETELSLRLLKRLRLPAKAEFTSSF